MGTTTAWAVSNKAEYPVAPGLRCVDLEVTLENDNPAADKTIDMTSSTYGGFSSVLAVESPIFPNVSVSRGELTGGTGATAVVATWNAVVDGYFKLNVDGAGVTEYGPCDFSGASITTMAKVAEVIEDALAATGATVSWSTDHFIIRSQYYSSRGSVSKATAGVTGTDISGAGATDFMDCDAGGTGEVIVVPGIGYGVQVQYSTTTLTVVPYYFDWNAVADGPGIAVAHTTWCDDEKIMIRVWGN